MKYFYKPSAIRWIMARFNFPFGRRVAIIGGGFAGCELGVFLAENGKSVTIIEESSRMGANIGPTDRFATMMKLRKYEVRTVNSAKVEEITSEGVKVNRQGTSEFFEADTVVVALGMQANKEAASQVTSGDIPVYPIGDCADAQRIAEAVKAGYRIAIEV
jgi:2,4-dienoyl-CoA reductase (NADPH2)